MFLNTMVSCVWLSVFSRNVGLSRPGSGAAEESVCHDEERSGERSSEEEVEVATDSTEQRGWQLIRKVHSFGVNA